MAYSLEFREAVAYSLSCLNERNQASSIRHREIRRVYGMVSKRKLRLPQVFWDKLAHARFALFPPPVTLIKQGLGTRLVGLLITFCMYNSKLTHASVQSVDLHGQQVSSNLFIMHAIESWFAFKAFILQR